MIREMHNSIGGLLAAGVGGGSMRAELPQHRCSQVACTLHGGLLAGAHVLAAPRGLSRSRPHAGWCTLKGHARFFALTLACSALTARIA